MNMTERIAYAITSSGKLPRDLAKEMGVSVARISQLKSGSGGIKAENLFAMARATGCAAQWIAEGTGDPHGQESNDTQPHFIHGLDSTTNPPLPFDRQWLERLGLVPEHLKYVCWLEDTMTPTLQDSDVLLLDETQTSPVNRGVYMIQRPHGGRTVKRLLQTMTSGWIIRSDKEDKRLYPDEVIQEEDLPDLHILGRVVWRGGRI